MTEHFEATKQWLAKLVNLPGVSGFEDQVRVAVKEKLSGLPLFWYKDQLGGIFATPEHSVDQDLPCVLICGHLDEVGFMLTGMTEQGMLRFQAIGGWSSTVLPAQRVEVITPKGPVLGVITSTPPHLLDDAKKNMTPSIEQMLIDVGASSIHELKSMMIRPGLSVVPYGPFTELNDGKRWLAKAWDNRYGVGLAVETLEMFHNENLPYRIVCGATVQEEVGLRGANAASMLIRPDIAFVLDASPANDAFQSGPQTNGKLGNGVLIRLMDRTMVTSPRMVEWIVEVAESEHISYQFYTSAGGTDAGQIHQSGIGVPTAVIGICSRYIHSANSMIDPNDYFSAKKLLSELLRRLTPERIAWLQGGQLPEEV